ncbi:MAG: hypothetical protein Q9213_008016 [Squamulea squamosa]
MDVSSDGHDPDTGHDDTDYDEDEDDGEEDEEEEDRDNSEDDIGGSGEDEKRSTWLPDKTAFIDKSVSFTHILVDLQITNLPSMDQQSIVSQSHSLWDRLQNAETRLNNLAPGNNRCPYCRDEVFAQPVCGDFILFLSTRIRVWDTAYKLLGIERRREEEMVRDQCLQFVQTYLGDREALGLDLTGEGWNMIDALKDACSTLLSARLNPSYRSVCKSAEDRYKLWAFGRAMRYRLKDLKVWYSNDPFVVWYGPEPSAQGTSKATRAKVRYAIQVSLLDDWCE